MFTATDFDKLQQIMDESPEKRELIQKLLDSHQKTLHTISHEIRNPLTLVYSTVQLMETKHPEIAAYTHWSSLREDIEYMKLLLEDLSSFQNGAQLFLTTFDCAAFLKSLVLSFASSLIDTDISFTSKIEENITFIEADEVKLREVLLNLLRNAREAVAANGSIYLHAYVNSQVLHIDVEDNGCGIKEDVLSHIFEPFITYKQGGTGLGLALAREIAYAHHGTLSVVSSQNIPTTFSLALPVKQDAHDNSR